MEDVRADDAVRREAEHEDEREPDQCAAADRRDAEDEAEHEAQADRRAGGSLPGRARGPGGSYSGMLPCLRLGCATRLVLSVSSAAISFGRVSRGKITSSM